LHRRRLAEEVGQRVDQPDEQRDREDRVLPPRIAVHYLYVPFGSTCTTELRCTCSSTPLATSMCANDSPSLVILPITPPAVTTSSPLASASIIAFDSFCRFICGRIITKYSTTNISTSGSMPTKLEPVSAAAPPVCAKASEMNTSGSSLGARKRASGSCAAKPWIVCGVPAPA